jgi:hypothetical protein
MLGQNSFIRKAIARQNLVLHHSHDVKEQSVLAAILAINKLPVIPDELDGVPVRVIETGEIRAF